MSDASNSDSASNEAERRYRRVLRLLPAGYRARWEEDMVTAYLEGAREGGPRLGERLSVVGLAIRLRLNGSYASPRGLVWYRVAHAMALMVLLYQAVAATVSTALGASYVIEYRHDAAPVYQSFFIWSRLFGLFWVAAFVAFVLGRWVAARVLVLLAAAGGIAITVVTVAGFGASVLTATEAIRWCWLLLSVAVVFVTPVDARAARPLWLGVYLVGSAVASTVVLPNIFVRLGYSPWIHFGDVGDLASAMLIVAMVVLLARSWPASLASPPWLLALAVVAGGVGLVRLTTMADARVLLAGDPLLYPSLAIVLVVAQLGLGVACAAVGLRRWGQVATAAAATPSGPASG